MKIAIVTHKFVPGDGQGRVNSEVARQALRAGHHLTLIATEVADEYQAHPGVTWVRVPVAGWPTALLQNQVFAARSAQWINAHREEFDVLQVNGFTTWAGADVNAVHFVHSAWLRSSVHSFRLRRDLYGVYQGIYTALNARLERRAFAGAKVVVAVSEQIRHELLQIGVPDEKIRVVVNGVDTAEFRPGEGQRRDLGLPAGMPLALFAGDIRTPRKNLDTVLKALAHAPGIHLAVAGETAGSPYPALSAALGLASRVHFLGFRRDIPDLMRAADLFVFPSRYEACSLVLLEALASGLPVITARTAGGSEIVTEDCGVVLPDPDDAAALADALCRMTGNPAQMAASGRAARAVAENHTWTKMASDYMNIFTAIAAGGPTS